MAAPIAGNNSNIGALRRAVWAPFEMGANALDACQSRASRVCAAAWRGIGDTAQTVHNHIPYTTILGAVAMYGSMEAYDVACDMTRTQLVASMVFLRYLIPQTIPFLRRTTSNAALSFSISQAKNLVGKAREYVDASPLSVVQKAAIFGDLNRIDTLLNNAGERSDFQTVWSQAVETLGRITADPEGPNESLVAAQATMEQLDPPEGVGADDSDVQRAQEEFAETLRFWSAYEYYQLLLSWFSTPAEAGSFTRIMREVITVGRNITDPKQRYALRKEKFLTELVRGELRAESSVMQAIQDIWAYIKKYVIVGTVLYLIEFNAEVFIKNGMDYVENVLKKISNQNSAIPESQIEIRHILYADEALNNLKNARRSWARDPRGGNSELHLGALLGSEFGFNREELYRFGGRLAADTFIPTYGYRDRESRLQLQGNYLFDVTRQQESPGKRYVGFDLLSQYMVRLENLAHNEGFSLFRGGAGIGPLGHVFIMLTRCIDFPFSSLRSLVDRLESENLSLVTGMTERFIRTVAAAVLFYIPYIVLSCVDRAIHSGTMYLIKSVITDKQELLRQIIEGTRDGMTLDRPQQYVVKKQIRDQLYAVLKEMQKPQGNTTNPPMPNKMRDALKTLLATTQTLVLESEHRTQEGLAAATQNTDSWASLMPGLVSVFKDKVIEEAIEQLTSLVGAAISTNMAEEKRNVYLTKGIRATSNTLTKLDVSVNVSDADIGQLDSEITELRKRLTHTLIDRAVADLIESSSSETIHQEALDLLRSANRVFIGDEGNQGLHEKWRQLLTEYSETPFENHEEKLRKAEALHKAIVEFGDSWITVMGRVANNDKIPIDVKQKIYDKFADLNRLYVHFEGPNALEEMKLHRTNTHGALHSGKPLRDSDDISANLAHIKRSSLLYGLLKEATHAKQRMRETSTQLQTLLESAQQQQVDVERLAQIKMSIQTQSNAFSGQLSRLKNLKNFESLRVFDPRQEDGSQISQQAFRDAVLTPLDALQTVCDEMHESVDNAIDSLSAAESLRNAAILRELQERANDSLPTGGFFSGFFSRHGCGDIITRIKEEYIANIPNSVEKHTLIARLDAISRCGDQAAVTQAMNGIRDALNLLTVTNREKLREACNHLTAQQTAANEMFAAREESWKNGIEVDGKTIHGLDGIPDHIAACQERLLAAIEQIPDALPAEEDFEEAYREIENGEARGTLTQTLLSAAARPFLPKIKKEIGDFVIKKTDVMMGIMDKGYAVQAVIDQAILAFVRGETGDTKFPRTARLIQEEEAL